MNKKDRDIVFKKYNGHCAYCGVELQKGWHADHIEPIVRNPKTKVVEKPENENLANYNPSCPSCNRMKNSHSLEEFRRIIKQFVNSLNEYSIQYKFAKKYSLIQENDVEVEFYFEKHGKQ